MITIIEGRLGGGKTYFATTIIMEYLAKGRHVWTNVDLVLDPVRAEKRQGLRRAMRVLHGVELDPGQVHTLEKVWHWHEESEWGVTNDPVLVVIDEAHLFFNARNWKETHKKLEDMLSFLTQSRKACVDVLFITQHAGNVDSQFRRLIQFVWHLRNIKETGVDVLSWILADYFLAIRKDYGGEVIQVKMCRRNRWVYGSYRTHAFLDSTMQELAERKKRLQPVKLRKVNPIVTGVKSMFWR